jgi:hypothetical protein
MSHTWALGYLSESQYKMGIHTIHTCTHTNSVLFPFLFCFVLFCFSQISNVTEVAIIHKKIRSNLSTNKKMKVKKNNLASLMTILRIKLCGDMDVHGCNFLSVT